MKLVEFSIAHISCSVSCIELKLGTNNEEGITFNATNFLRAETERIIYKKKTLNTSADNSLTHFSLLSQQ